MNDEVSDGTVTALETFLARFRDSVRNVTGSRIDLDQMSLRRGVPPFALREMLSTDPLSVFIPAEHGGPGFPASAGLAAMEVAAYEHLPLSLLLAINGLLCSPSLGTPAPRSRAPSSSASFVTGTSRVSCSPSPGTGPTS